MKIEIKTIEELNPYAKNPRKHPPKQIKLLADNIKRFGFTTPALIDKDNNIIAGHGRVLAMKALGKTDIPCVRMGDLTEEEVKALRLADNQIASMGADDMDLVVEELKGLSVDLLDLTGYSSDLILDDDPDDDFVPEVHGGPSKLGQIWELGKHRIMCGDSTKKEDVDKLMNGKKAQMCFTDPPYNVDYDGSHTTEDLRKEDRKILNDSMTKEKFTEFLEAMTQRIVENVEGGVYICMSSSEIDTLKRAWEGNGGHWQSFIIWVKNNFILSRADYQHTFEPILYGWPKGIVNHYFVEERGKANVWEDLRDIKTEFKDGYTTISFQGFKVRVEGEITKGEVIRKKQRTDVWRHNKPTRSAEHPTMKPVSLCSEAIFGSSQKEDIVLDLFLGSGSTLIAAEKTGRVCYGMELDSKYIATTIARWELYTKQKAKRIKF